MRTKTLLCAAALAAGAMTAMAQSNVYSLNVVGYVNLTLHNNAFTMVANQLDVDGNGTNNTIGGVYGTSLPQNAAIYKWNSGNGNFDIFNYSKSGKATAPSWSPNSLASVNPGEMQLVQLPAGSDVTLTTVGNVLQGPAFAVNNGIPALGGFCGLSSIAPISGLLQTDLHYNPQQNEAVYKWNSGNGNFDIYNYTKSGKATAPSWSPAQPTMAVGDGFMLQSKSGSTWSNNFIVQ